MGSGSSTSSAANEKLSDAQGKSKYDTKNVAQNSHLHNELKLVKEIRENKDDTNIDNSAKVLSTNKLKKLAFGQQGYRDIHRDYDEVMSTLDLNKTSEVEWNQPTMQHSIAIPVNKSLSNSNDTPGGQNKSKSVSTPHSQRHNHSNPQINKRNDINEQKEHNKSDHNLPVTHQTIMAPATLPKIGSVQHNIPLPSSKNQLSASQSDPFLAVKNSTSQNERFKKNDRLMADAKSSSDKNEDVKPFIMDDNITAQTPVKVLKTPFGSQIDGKDQSDTGMPNMRAIAQLTKSPIHPPHNNGNNVSVVGSTGQKLPTRPFGPGQPNIRNGPLISGTESDEMIANFSSDKASVLSPSQRPANVPPLSLEINKSQPSNNENNFQKPQIFFPNDYQNQNYVNKSYSANFISPGPISQIIQSPHVIGGKNYGMNSGHATPAGVMSSQGPGSVQSGPSPIGAIFKVVTPAPPTQLLPAVKETTDVKRNRAQLPDKLTHAQPTTGDWLKKRYIVNNYILLETLGTGSYGEVRLCKDRTTDKLYAIKIISKDFLKKRKNGINSETYFEDIKREIAIMKKLQHPNVLRLFEVLDDPNVNKMYLVLEYMKMGDLVNILKSRGDDNNDRNDVNVSQPTGEPNIRDTTIAANKAGGFTPLNDLEVWNIFRQVVAGIRYLHFQNVIHGDIKPQNLLLGEDGIVKIADFGISQMLAGSDDKLADAAGTPAFMSPELCERKSFSGQLADVWAIGASIYMLRFGQPPFMAKNILNLHHKIVNDPLVFPWMIDPGLRNLLENILIKDPNERFTLQQIIMHPWLRHPPTPIPGLYRAPNVTTGATQSYQGINNNPNNHMAHHHQNANNALNKNDNKQIGSKGLSFMPPPSYIAEEAAAMNNDLVQIDNDELFKSIGMRVRKKERSSKSALDNDQVSETKGRESGDVDDDDDQDDYDEDVGVFDTSNIA
eukprot:gene4059-5802_t